MSAKMRGLDIIRAEGAFGFGEKEPEGND